MSKNKTINKLEIVEEAKKLLQAGDAKSSSGLLKKLVKEFSEDMEIASLLGSALFYSNQFIEAETLLSDVLKKEPSNKNAWGFYYRSLRRQGKLIQCVDINRSEYSNFPEDPFFYGESFAALGLTGNVKEVLSNKSKYREHDGKGLCWLAAAYQSEGDHEAVVTLMAAEGDIISQDVMLQQLLLRSLSYTENNIDSAYSKFSLITGDKDNKIWAYYELARYMDVSSNKATLSEQSERPFNIEPTPYCPKITGFSKVEINNSDNISLVEFKTPRVDQERLKENITQLISVVSSLYEDGIFDKQIANINAVRKLYAPEENDPVQILSTGRCGTIGFYKLLCRSKNVLPYHTLGWQLIPSDRNHMLYRILEGTFDRNIIIRIFTDYLENRISEIMYAYRLGRTPVIINHWDTIFSPLWSVIFPDSHFLHVFRSDEKVFESLYTKNQFQNEQLHYCQFDASFPKGQFLLSYDERSIEEEIAWYLYITREFASAFREVLGVERTASLASENIFKARQEDYDLLQKMIPLNDLTYEDYCEHYSKPINSKLEKQQTPAGWVKSKERFLSSIEELNFHGEFLSRKNKHMKKTKQAGK